MRDSDGNYIYETNPETGKPIYVKTGEKKTRTQKSTRMAETDDAYTLLSDHPNNKEILYADFANKMKAMGNNARKEYLVTPNQKMVPEAKKKYAKELAELDAALNKALKNASRERQAQLIANQIVADAMKNNPDMDGEEKKRIRGQALIGARNRAGAKKDRIIFTEKQWEAINAGAVSENKLVQLLKNADPDNYKALATPHASRVSGTTAKYIKDLLNAGWSRTDIENAGYASMSTIRAVEDGKYDADIASES